MNIISLLTPKSNVVYVQERWTLRQALEKMEQHRYTCVPVIREDGTYAGTISEGDLLWAIMNRYVETLRVAEHTPLADIPRNRNYEPANVNANMTDIFRLAQSQNFVPVVDDRNVFIGIVTRKDILQYFMENYCVDPCR